MKANLRKLWMDVQGSYWFMPTVLSLLAAGLATLTITLDMRGGGWWLLGTGWLQSSGVEGARSQLTVVASAMITMASTVFAITIAAVAYASGNYGPRLLTNFMNDRGNQLSLGVFIATFVYALLVLRVVDGEDGDAFVPQLSLFVSTVMVVLAVGVLVYFLHHIPASIRINSVLAGIGRALLRDIDARFPEACEGEEPRPPAAGAPVFPDESGYVEIVDFRTLDELAAKAGAVIALKVRVGDFVHPAVPIAEISGSAADRPLAEKVSGAFAIGSSRTRPQDLQYPIDELVEIALRALSPGINDPFTAVSSLHWMGAALARLAARDLRRGPEPASYDPDRVRPLVDDFGHFLARSFGAVRRSAAGSPIAAGVFLSALESVAAAAATGNRRRAVMEEAARLMAQAEIALDGPALDELRERFEGLARQKRPRAERNAN